MGLTESEALLARALYWCMPCLDGKHDECEAPCGCTLHPPTGKVNKQLERFGHVGVTFTDEQKQQIQAHFESQEAASELVRGDGRGEAIDG